MYIHITYMLDIPPEILFEIGKLLDGPSLVACLQVARDWHNILHPLSWRTISHRHWIRGEFPLMHWVPLDNKSGPHTKGQEQREAKILQGLLHTRSITFHNLKELKIAGRWYTGASTLGTVPDKIEPWKLQILKIDRFDLSFLPYCPEVKELTLDLNGIKESKRPVDPLLRKKILEQVHGLSKLNAINLSMHCFGQVDVQKFVKDKIETAHKDDVIRWIQAPRSGTVPQWSVRKKKPVSLTLLTLEDIFALFCG
ncbi:hypothetical protein BGZ97_007671 [Linnemannia gamsii]|uniref:F-box domain-containing protein n=1 Tax=Linnemannia gamsii TaxID=64522 RepID=A0A9P6RCY7_9FUNG|nr:hypothetical protein BGZ97_007671 [Linnemannia gamsii]